MGTPTVTICTDRFRSVAEAVKQGLGMPSLPLVILPHPIGGLKAEEVINKADGIIDEIVGMLCNP